MVKALMLVCVLAAAPALASQTLPEGAKLNACGCYQDDAGNCRCVKKGRCACPGECEPVGCDEKRQKQLEKEAQAELKRIAEREKKKEAEAKRAARKRKGDK